MDARWMIKVLLKLDNCFGVFHTTNYCIGHILPIIVFSNWHKVQCVFFAYCTLSRHHWMGGTDWLLLLGAHSNHAIYKTRQWPDSGNLPTHGRQLSHCAIFAKVTCCVLISWLKASLTEFKPVNTVSFLLLPQSMSTNGCGPFTKYQLLKVKPTSPCQSHPGSSVPSKLVFLPVASPAVCTFSSTLPIVYKQFNWEMSQWSNSFRWPPITHAHTHQYF